ncbi:hypothetical protein K523DRAFT_225684 [Schizophyllum commune Tattone D]|nr:hypothetical protein K523DRAFT_225684 [Schizophyllum commune Tattone D]
MGTVTQAGPLGTSTYLRDAPLLQRTPSCTLPQWIHTLPTRISNWTRSLMKKARLATHTIATIENPAIELKETTEHTPSPHTGIPPPNAFYFRLSDVDEYRDIFTLAPLTRQDFPPTNLPLPAHSLLREEPQPEHRLPLHDRTPIALLPPISHYISPPPPRHAHDDSSPSVSGTTDHNPICRLVPANFLMRFDGFPTPEMLFLLESVDGGPPPLLHLQYGSPIPILSLTDDPSTHEIWPVEAIRFDPDTNRAIIIASYEGCAVPVLVPFHIVDTLPNRLNIWQAFRAELADEASAQRHGALTRADLTRIHDKARDRIVSEVKDSIVSVRAPEGLSTHIVRLLGMHALPGS